MKINQQPEHSWEEVEKILIPYLLHATPPVSVDTLCALSGAPVLPVLNALEGMKRKGLVTRKKGTPQGVYFPNAARLVSLSVAGVVRNRDPPGHPATDRVL